MLIFQKDYWMCFCNIFIIKFQNLEFTIILNCSIYYKSHYRLGILVPYLVHPSNNLLSPYYYFYFACKENWD